MSIPISEIVNVVPRLITAGQTGLAMNGLILSENDYIPVGKVYNFTSAKIVGQFFGYSSNEYNMATTYFNSYANSFIKPKNLYMYKHVKAPAKAWIRGGAIKLTLAQLKALKGVMDIDLNGTTKQLTLDFSAATSPSEVAALIQTAVRAADTTDEFTKATVVYNSSFDAFTITSGKAGAGTTIGYCLGVIANDLKLTLALGAEISQGADAQTPTEVMESVILVTDNFVTFTNTEQPNDLEAEEFATWASNQGVRYLYVVHSIDPQLEIDGNTTNIGSILTAGKYGATTGVFGNNTYAAFIMGAIAGIDFNRASGVVTLAFKNGIGLADTVTDSVVAKAIRDKNFNYYGRYAENNLNFSFFYPGTMFGDYLFIDPYVNAIWLNANIQRVLMQLLAAMSRVPYNDKGYAQIEAVVTDVLETAKSVGVIDSGVTLSAGQQQQVISEVGSSDIVDILQNIGYYLQVQDPGAVARSSRDTPIIGLWYTYAGAVQKLSVASTLIA